MNAFRIWGINMILTYFNRGGKKGVSGLIRCLDGVRASLRLMSVISSLLDVYGKCGVLKKGAVQERKEQTKAVPRPVLPRL